MSRLTAALPGVRGSAWSAARTLLDAAGTFDRAAGPGSG
jgi:hypothetical protein